MTSSSSMTIITPKPSVIFSTTSSSSSIRSCCGDDDNGNGNVGEEGEFDGQEDEQIGLYVDDSAGNDDDDDDDDDDEQKITTLFSSSTTTPSTTTATSTTTDEAQIHKLTTMQTTTRKIMTALMMNISKRILQLFMIHFFVYISITVYYQSTNRLLIKDIIGSSGDGGLISSSILTSNTNTNSNTTLFNDISINNDNDNNSSIDHQDCYYVPGGGFSGYWFLLGRLQNMKRHQNNMNDKKFVCYSSGCLGVIATLLMNDNNNNNVDSIYNMARTIQMEWNEGRLHQYQVVESFIDGLLSPVLDNDNNKEQQQQQEEAFLETIRNNLYIITSTYDDNSNNSSTNMLSSIIPTAIIQQPTNIQELKQMLLQTAWIPLVTGSSWTYKNQMDGAFSTFQHPKCHTNIELIVPEIVPAILRTKATAMAVETEPETETETKPSITIMQALKLWTNILNVNLKKNDVDILWKMGFDYGV